MFDDARSGTERGELFDPRSHQGHLLIVRVWDDVSPVVTKFCPTGYKEINGRRYANNAVRCSIVDLDELGEDGLPGKVYPEVMIFTGLLVADLKRDVGRKILVVWRQKDPTDKSSPYTITEMKSNQKAYDLGMSYMQRHPEFDQIQGPPPWQASEPQQAQNTAQNGHSSQAYSGGDPWAESTPAAGNGSFLSQTQGQTNHWGQPQTEEAPF